MQFKEHSKTKTLVPSHALLSPSNYHWINYTDEKLRHKYKTFSASVRGSNLHELVHRAISLKIKLDPNEGAISCYVSDAIDLNMSSEQFLYYSDNAYGTADTISFDGYILRVHDLKTGVTPVKPTQLELYAALFCLEYDVSPETINIELRIYQGDDIFVYEPTVERIIFLMDRIVYSDQFVNDLRNEVL